MKVPFFRPSLGQAEIDEVVDCLRSGWLTTGQKCKAFEEAFAGYVGARHAVALGSCTAALHLALEAVGLGRGEMVLVPALTFAATAEVVRYFDAVPVFVDCEPATLCMDVEQARRTASAIAGSRPVAGLRPPYGKLRAIMPMHYGGQMCDVSAVEDLAGEFGLATIEDAAHAVPASFRGGPGMPWRNVGTTADVTCFSFYANKCITTGEGGMAVTDRADLAERMRVMSLHGMSKDAWKRYTAEGSWYYEIVAPGFKYNMTDIAAALGIKQLARADEFRQARGRLAAGYRERLGDLEQVELPVELPDRRHSWHLYEMRLNLDRLAVDRAEFMRRMAARGVSCSVHWMPLHLHPYYRNAFGTGEGLFPESERQWPRLVSLPIFPSMTGEELSHVCESVRGICREAAR